MILVDSCPWAQSFLVVIVFLRQLEESRKRQVVLKVEKPYKHFIYAGKKCVHVYSTPFWII